MKTKLLQSTQIDEAATILLQGGLVVFPTETVYGLGADGLDEIAVKGIFNAKGRPSDNPLILHIYDAKQLHEIVEGVPDTAQPLIQAFWPGPLTLVFNKQPHIPAVVTAGLDTVAIRMPNHEIAHNLLKAVNRPIAAPSANLSGRPSSTKLDHVINDLDGKVDAVIDGGNSVIGIESTVLDLTTTPPTLLRPGYISTSEIESVLGFHIQTSLNSETPKSPGMKYQHYQPSIPVYWRSGNPSRIQEEMNHYGTRIGIIEHPTEQLLYALLRDYDRQQYDVLVVLTEPSETLPEGLRDRLSKASVNYKFLS